MPDLRTDAAVQKLVDSIQEDFAEAAGHLKRGLEVVRALEGPTRGINGLASFLKAQGMALEAMISHMEDESAKVVKTMLGKTDLPAVQDIVNPEKKKVATPAEHVEAGAS